MSPKIAIGFDHGNGYVKGKSDLVKRYIIPSAIAYRSNVSSSIGESLKEAGRKLSEGTSNLDTDTTYVWGEDVYTVKGYIATNGHQDRIKSIPYKVLSEVALGELAGDQELIEAVIVTGVPSQQTATDGKDLKAFMEKPHVASVGDKNVVIKPLHVVVLPQPVGTIMYLYLDEEGYVRDASYQTDKVLVIDLGRGTSDVDVIEGLRRQNEFFSLETGMYDVYDLIVRDINSKNPNAKATVAGVEKYFEEAVYKVSNRVKIDFAEAKKRAINEVGTTLSVDITGKLKTWDRFDKIVLTGGGAQVFAEYFKKFIPDIEIIDDSQFANAEGFYRYAKYIVGVKYDTESVPAKV